MTNEICNEKEKNFSFYVDELDWVNIEKEIVNYYCLDEKIGNIYYPIDYGIMDCAIYTEKYIFEFTMGILNASEKGWMITICPNKLLENDIFKQKILKR